MTFTANMNYKVPWQLQWSVGFFRWEEKTTKRMIELHQVCRFKNANYAFVRDLSWRHILRSASPPTFCWDLGEKITPQRWRGGKNRRRRNKLGMYEVAVQSSTMQADVLSPWFHTRRFFFFCKYPFIQTSADPQVAAEQVYVGASFRS